MRNMLRSIAAAILLVLASTAGASAQCSGQAPATTYCGNPTGALALPGWKPISGLPVPLIVGTTTITGGSPSASYQSFLTNNNGTLANGHIVDIGCGVACPVGLTNNFNVYPLNAGNGVQLGTGTGVAGEGGSVTFFTKNPASAAPIINQELGFVQICAWNGSAYCNSAQPAIVWITTEAWNLTNNGAGNLFQATTRGQATARGEACIAEGLTVALMSGSCTIGLGIGTINSGAGTYDTSVRVLSSVNPTMTNNQNNSTSLTVANSSTGTSASSTFTAANSANVAQYGIGGTGNTALSSLLQNKAFIYSSTGAAGIILYADAAAHPITAVTNGTEVWRALLGFMVGTTTDPGAGLINVATGYRIANAATSGNVLRGDGTNFISATLSGSDITGAALTKTDDTNVTLTLGGTPTTALLRAASLTLGWTGQLSLTRGGTNASLTASNGGIFYSTASAGAILSGTATARQMLQSGASTTPAWSTTTWPATTTINRILYSSSASVIGEITTGNSSVLVTDSGGIPSLSTTLPAHTLGGTISGGGNQINNVIIGTTTPLAGSFTTLSASTSVTSPIYAATGSLTFQSNGSTFAGNITTGQQWFLSGTSNAVPTGPQLTVSKNTSALPAIGTPTGVSGTTQMVAILGGVDASPADLLLQSFGSNASIRYMTSAGTAASRTATATLSGIGVNFWYGYTGTVYAPAAGFAVTTIDNWSGGTTTGARLELYATASGGTSLAIAAYVQAGFSIGTTTDPGVGGLYATGATIRFSGLASDTAQTDNTVCVNSTGVLLKGTGALGICLGTSGEQFKTAFAPMVAGIDDLMKIDFQNYRYRQGYGDNGARIQYGTTAQNVEAVLPDLVNHAASGEAINYDSGALIFIGLRAIQQLKADNDNLRLELARKKG